MADGEDGKETPKPNQAELDKLEGKIEGVQQKIDETPSEDKDEQWRTKLASDLAELTAQVKALADKSGASPEVAALMTEVQEMRAELKTLAQSRPQEKPEAAQGSLETPTETLSETPQPKPLEGLKEPHASSGSGKVSTKEKKAKVWL